MDQFLRNQCRGLLSIWLAQLKSGQPPSPMLQGPEFVGSLESLCARLEAESSISDVADGDSDYAFELIVAGNPQAGLDLLSGLRKWLAGASSVILCDPYFLHFRSSKMFSDQTAYINAVTGIFPATVTSIDLYVTGYTNTVRTEMLNSLKNGRNVRVFDTDGLHDRFIFKNHGEAKVLGTSFGGLGNKFFFTENLTRRDGAEVLAELRRIAPFPTQLNRGSKSP